MNIVITIAVAVAALACWGDPAGAGIDAGDACKSAKAAAIGKKAADLLQAFGKNLRSPDPLKLSQGVSKAQSKFTEKFARAESKGGCDTVGDAAAIEARVDTLVLEVIEDQGATCGNFVVGGSEECDAGPTGGPSPDCWIGCLPDCTCHDCGDGMVNVGDDCDDGPANGTPDSCCTLMCTFKPESTPCTDTDGNVCTVGGCTNLGICDQLHLTTPASTPCPDSDGNPATTAGCDGFGTCDQLHIE